MADAQAPQPKRRRRSRSDLPDTTDPVEIAMGAANSGKAPSGAAASLLEKQARLIDAQLMAQRLLIVLRVLLAAGALALIVAAGSAIYRASKTQSLVIEQFAVPPALAAQGLSGEVMATRLLDQITLMQSRTLSTRPADSYGNNWGDDVDIAIPNTGATIGDIRKLLRSWVGQETRISGEVVRTANGWSVTARVSGQPAITATGGDLDALVMHAAEGVFRQTQPYRYVIYLMSAGRGDEALAAARELALNGPEEERPWGVVAYANALSTSGASPREQLPAARRAAEALPDVFMPVNNYASILVMTGYLEEALGRARQAEEAIGDGSGISDQFRGETLATRGAYEAVLLGNHQFAATAFEASMEVGTPAFAVDNGMSAAIARLSLHEVRASDALMRRVDEITGFNRDSGLSLATSFASIDLGTRLALLQNLASKLARPYAIGDLEALRVEAARALPRMEALSGTVPDPAWRRDIAAGVWPSITSALIDAGHAADANRLLAGTPDDCYPCLVARGEAAAALGRMEEANRLFVEAVRQGPSLPQADESWGRALARRGAHQAALAHFDRAARLGGRWADPLKWAGDSLARLGRDAEAVRRYAAAAERAPRWGGLQIDWGEALLRQGRTERARARFRAAAGMDLGAPDRARLQQIRNEVGF